MTSGMQASQAFKSKLDLDMISFTEKHFYYLLTFLMFPQSPKEVAAGEGNSKRVELPP